MRYLKAGYSPEQIAGTLAVPSLQVSQETIYTAIYAMPRGVLRTEVSAGCASVMPNVAHVRVVRIDGGRFPTWSASMTGRLRSRSAWYRDTGRAT